MDKSTHHILCTKSLPEDILLSASRDGLQIDCMDFIKITLQDAAVLSHTLEDIKENDFLLFTSQHAVKAVYPLLQKKPLKVYCISGATRQAVLRYLPDASIIAAEKDAALLVQKIDTTAQQTHYFFCGNKSLPTIPAFLDTHHLVYRKIEVYTNEAMPQKVEQVYDTVLFFSPSIVESYFVNNTAPALSVCIGNTTEKAVRLFTDNAIITADEPTIENMLAKIRK